MMSDENYWAPYCQTDLTGYGINAGNLSITLPTVPRSRPAILFISFLND
jgi:hypothetical protein